MTSYSRLFRKSTASILAVALVAEVFFPAIAFAAPASFTAAEITASAPSIAQVVTFDIPETLTGGDTVSLAIDGTPVSQVFDTTHDITLDFLKTKIDGMFSASGITSARSGNTFTIASHSGGVVVGGVQLTHDPLAANERISNVVAQTREVEFPVVPTLLPGDTVSIVVDGSGILVPYSLSATNTLDALALSISGSTAVNAEYVTASGTLHLTAKTPWVDFSVSNLRIVSAGVSPAHIQENVVPVAQVDTINLPRPLYSGETVSMTLSGNTVATSFAGTSADTLTAFASQISALPFVGAVSTGSLVTLTAKTPGTPFTSSNLFVSGGTLPVFSIAALKQKEMIVIPRDFVNGDTIYGSVNGYAVSQAFSGSSTGTIVALASAIDSLTGVTAAVDVVGGFPVVYVESEVAGKAFSMGTFSVNTELSFTVTPATPAVFQKDSISLPRAMVAGDRLDVSLEGSTVSKTFSGSSSATMDDIAAALSAVSSTTVGVVASGNMFTATSLVAGTPFTLGAATIVNSVSPIILDAGQNPVREEHTYSLPSAFSDNDSITLTVNGQSVSTLYSSEDGATVALEALATQIAAIPDTGANVDIFGLLHVYSTLMGGSVTTGDLTVTSNSSVVWLISSGFPETRANATVFLDDINILAGTGIIGNCSIFFGTGVVTDYNCADGSATVEVVADTGSVAALLRGISGLTYGVSGIALVASGSDNAVEYVRASQQTDSDPIVTDFSGVTGISVISNTPAIAAPEEATISFQRDFAQNDSIAIHFSTGVVTQSFVSDQATTMSGMVSLLSGLAVVQGVSILNARTLDLHLAIGTAMPTVTITNTIRSQVVSLPDPGKKQKIAVDFNTDFVSGDHIALEVNGTPVSADFVSDSVITLANLTANIAGTVTSVDATMSGSRSIILTSQVEWENTLSVANISVRGGASVVNIDANDVGIPSVADFTFPFVPASSDVLAFSYSGVTVEQAFDTDADKTLLALSNSIANTFSGTFATSFEPVGKTLRLVAHNVNTSLASAHFSATGALAASNTQVNVEQTSEISFFRPLVTGDSLTIDVNGTPVSAAFTTDENTTITNWCAGIDALSGVTCVPDLVSATKKITIALETPETGPFTLSGLAVTTTVPVVNLVANVVAVAQIRDIVFPRALVSGDAINFDLDGNALSFAFSGSNDETLSGMVDTINALPSSLAFAQVMSSNTIRLIAKTAGVPFVLAGPVTVINTLANPTDIKPNIVAVAQETDLTIPALITGDSIAITVDGSGVTQTVGSDTAAAVATFVASIDALANVGATLSGSIVTIKSSIPGRAFLVSTFSRTNTIPVTVQQVFIPAVAQSVKMTPANTVKGWTYRATINGRNYSYLTVAGDTDSTVIDTLGAAMLSDVDVNVSTGATDITVSAKIAGTPFTYDAIALDLTAPVVTTPTNIAEILKSGSTSTSTVSIDEDGAVYFVLTGATVANYSDILTQVGLGNAFLAVSPATADTVYQVNVPSGINDGLYNIVAIDNAVPNRNVSSVYPGWLTVDNTAPGLVIHTPSGTTTSTTGIILTGTTDPNTLVSASGASFFATGVSDVSGDFSFSLPLTADSVNNFQISSSDIAGNTATAGFVITQDSINPALTINTSSPLYISGATADIAGTTEAGLTVNITEVGSGVVASATADGSGAFSVSVTPATDSVTDYTISVQDSANNSSTGSVQVIQDSIDPGIALAPLPSIIDADSVVVAGTTDPSISVAVSNGAFSTGATTDGSGAFSFVVPLTQNTTNTIAVVSTDLSGRSGSGSAVIVEDSIANTLSLSGGNATMNADSYTLSGTTKPAALVSVTGTAGSFTGVADGVGHFEFILPLAQDQINTFDIDSTDTLANSATGSVVITEDSIAPSVAISTAAQTTYGLSIVVAGTAEPLASVVVSGGSGAVNTVADGSGAFSVLTELTPNSANTLLVTATDAASNVGTGSVVIMQDPTPIFLNLTTTGSFTQSGTTFTITGDAKPLSDYIIGGGVLVLTGTIDVSGSFAIPVDLTTNTTNNLVMVVSDAVSTATGGLSVTVDTLPPTLSFSGVPALTNSLTASFTVLSEAGADVVFTDGSGGTFSGVVSASGTLDTTLPLVADTNNTFSVLASDILGNTATGSVSILQDSTAPTATGITVATSLTGGIASIDYSFAISESGSTVFMVGTGSNVLGTLVASSNTLSGTIVPLLPDTDYFYQIQSTDLAGNTSLTAPASVRTPSTPVIPPVVPPVTPPTTTSGGSGGSGAGAGGAGIIYYDYCPGGDNSGNFHDSKCGIPQTSTSSGSTVSSGSTSGTSSGTVTHTPSSPIKRPTSSGTSSGSVSGSNTPASDNSSSDIGGDTGSVDGNLPQDVISGNKKNDTSTVMTPVADLVGFEAHQYIFVEHVVIVREQPNFMSKEVAYLPRNVSVEVLASGRNWSQIRLQDGAVAYIRSVFLRTWIPADAARTLPFSMLQNATDDRIIELRRKVQIKYSVFVRSDDTTDSKIKAWLYNGTDVYVIDTVGSWSEIRYDDGTGFVRTKYLVK